MAPDLRLLEVLTRHGVPFVVIGGHAVNVHGSLRATEDTDAVWIRSADAESRLLAALRELDAHVIGSVIDPATGIERTHPVTAAFIRSERVMMLRTTAVSSTSTTSCPAFRRSRPPRSGSRRSRSTAFGMRRSTGFAG